MIICSRELTALRCEVGRARWLVPGLLGSRVRERASRRRREFARHTRWVTASATDALTSPRLHCGIVLHAEEGACQVFAGGEVVSVRYALQFPAPRRERVLPGHLVAIAGAPGAAAVVVWRWYDAVVLGSSNPGSVRLWEPAHGEVEAQRRWPQQQYGPGTRAYLSAGLPGAKWWVAGRTVDQAGDARVELDEVGRLYTEHSMWGSAFG